MASAFPPIECGTGEIKDVITCFICKGDLDDQLIQLNCFHVCHKSCLKRSLRKDRTGSSFFCSECKTINMIPAGGIEGLSDELLQYKMKNVDVFLSNTNPICKMCEGIGEQILSANYCMTCKINLCQNDTKRHNALHGDHRVITNAEFKTAEYFPSVLSSFIKQAMCPNHPTKILEFYCQQCQLPGCQECSVKDHRFHTSISNIQKASRQLKEELKNKTAQVLTQKEKCELVKNKLEQLLKEIETDSNIQIEKCKKWGEDVKQTVDKVVEKKIQNIQNVTQINQSEIRKISEEKKYQNKQFQSAKNYMDVFLKFGSESDFLLKYKKLLENLEICLQQTTKVQIPIKRSTVDLKNVKENEKNLEEMLVVETIDENYEIPQPHLRGCELVSKWQIVGKWTGVAVDGENVIAVRDNQIEGYDMNGQRKGQVEGLEHVFGYDIEVSNNQLFVTDSNTKEILVLDGEKKIDRKMSLPIPKLRSDWALGLAVDHTNQDLYVASEGNTVNTVYRLPKGRIKAYPIITGVNGIWFICVTQNHEVILSMQKNHKVCKYNSEGTLIWEYGKFGEGQGEMNTPSGVCVDSWGHVFVCDHYNHRIHHLSPEGTFLSFINIGEKMWNPQTITFNNQKMFITCRGLGLQRCCMFIIKCQYSCY